MSRRTRFVPVNVTEDVRAALRSLGLDASAVVGERLTVSRLVLSMIALAREDLRRFTELASSRGTTEAERVELAVRGWSGSVVSVEDATVLAGHGDRSASPEALLMRRWNRRSWPGRRLVRSVVGMVRAVLSPTRGPTPRTR